MTDEQREAFEDAFGVDDLDAVAFDTAPHHTVDAKTRTIVAPDGRITQLGDPGHPENR